MGLSDLQLQEPLIDAMVSLLSTSLNTAIDELNATYTDVYKVEHVTQFLPFVPVPSTLLGGLPAIGIQELETEFEDDTQFSLNADHHFAVVVVVQNVDHHALALQMRRSVQAVSYVVQADRLLGNAAGSGGVMRNQGGALGMRFIRTVPGPLLGDIDPNNAEAPPKSYLSWTGMEFATRRVEVG
jgi:hypothetical protein